MSAQRRAVTDEQKSARRRLLIHSAWSLFQAQDYATISMADVARASGLAKGTLYLYFTTKEGLFLAVLAEQCATWFDAIDTALDEGQVRRPDQLVSLLVDSLATRPHLVRLFALAHVVLEQNIDYGAAYAYKRMLQTRLAATGRRLEAQFGWLQAGQGAQFLLRAYALVIGLESLAHPAPIVAKVLAQEAELAGFQVDFATEFAALLRGLVLAYATPDGSSTGGAA